MELPYLLEALHLRTTATAFILTFAPLMALLSWVARPVPQASAATLLLLGSFGAALGSLMMIRRSRAILTTAAALVVFLVGAYVAIA